MEPGPVPGSARAEEGDGSRRVRLELQPVGPDWLLVITGGRSHVGAVAVADPADEPGAVVRGKHREGPLAAECAALIARETGRGCAAVAGIHQDDATPQEIAVIVTNVRCAAAALARWARDLAGADQR